MYIAKRFFGNSSEQFDPSYKLLKMFRSLQERMKNNDVWSSCSIKVTNNGKYNFDFGYGMPPMVEGRLRRTGEIQ